jgi:signal peptidase II
MKDPLMRSASGTMTTTKADNAVTVTGNRSYVWIWSILSVVLVSDQLTKWAIVEKSGFQLGIYPPFGGKVLIPGFFNFAYAVNHGAAWGVLEGYSWLLVLFAIVVLVLIVVFRKELNMSALSSQWCFGLISGGIIGNTLDRVFRGHVVDFLDIRLPGYQWPTFNIADSAIVVGTLLYIYLQSKPNKSG